MVDPFKTFAPEDLDFQTNVLSSGYQSTPYSMASTSAAVVSKLLEVNTRAPWLSPETMMTLAKANASVEAIDRVGQYAGQRQMDNYEQSLATVGELWAPIRWAYDGLGFAAKVAKATYNKILPTPAKFLLSETGGAVGAAVGNAYDVIEPDVKATTRWGIATLDAIPETIQNIGAGIVGKANYDFGGAWRSYSIATMLEAKIKGEDMGEGYFMPERLRDEQARRARLYRGITSGGSAWTWGRGAAGLVFREGTQPYHYASGIIDAAVNVFSPDPTSKIVKVSKATLGGVGAVSSGLKFAEGYKAGGGIRGIVPMLSEEDALTIRKNFRDKAHGEAGLIKDITGGNVTDRGVKFVNWMRTNPAAKRLVNQLKEEKSPGRIQDEIFKYKISNDMAVRIANANTEDEIISAMTEGWTYGKNALSANIGKYKVNRSPLANLRKSKYFTQFPKKTIIVDGDEFQSAEAVKNSVFTMRSGGVPESDIRQWLDGTPSIDGKPAKMGAIAAFTGKGSAVDRKNTLDSFNGLVALTLKANGVTEPIIEEVMKLATSHIDRVKTLMSDKYGHGTDSGHLAMQLEQLKDQLPADIYNTYFEGLGDHASDLQFAQPMQIVDMLNRMQVLPDVRKLRRLTRNRLMANLIPKDEKGVALFKKMAITSGKKRVTLTKILDEDAWQAADDELMSLESLEGPARLQANERIDELYDIKKRNEEKYEDSVISGNQRLTLEYIEKIQNDIWKPLNLATFGYILRNGMDAQMRMAFGGINNLSHPLDYIYLVLGSKYGKDIRGVDITGLGMKRGIRRGDEIEDELQGSEGYAYRAGNVDAQHRKEVYDDLREGISYRADRVGFTASDSYVRGVETGSFPLVSRNDAGVKYPSKWHTDGVVQAGQKIIADPLQSVAARGLSAGLDDDAIVDMVFEYLKKNPNSPAMLRLQSLYRDGINYWKSGNLKKGWPVNLKALRKNDPALYESQLRGHIRTIVLPNVKTQTGELDDIKFMFAHDRVPYFERKIDRPVSEFVLRKNQKKLEIGDLQTIVDDSGQKVTGVINNISEDVDGQLIATFVPVQDGAALSRGAARGKTGSRDARRRIERSPLYDESPELPGKGLPKKVAREQIYWDVDQTTQLDAMKINAVNFFFNNINDTITRKLEKSPVFRTYYYKTIGEHIDQLSREEGIKLYNDIASKADDAGQTIAQYLGEDAWYKITGSRRTLNVSKKIEGLPTRTNATGTLTVEELDDFSRFKGLSDTKNLLYDASNRNNFGDAMRVVAPFAGAWADVMGRWGSFALTNNVQLARSGQRVYSGLTNADPDNDGRGMFYRDPQTDELMFTFPFSGGLSKILTGVVSPLTGPVKRLSGGMSVLPALGPWGQFAANKLIPDVPDYQSFRQLLSPYGEKTLIQTINPLPGYVEKFASAIAGDTENLTAVFGQTYIETLRALSVNPKYNLNTEEGIVNVQADAKSRARILTIMRAVSQFVGPTAGTLEFKVPTEQGDVFVSELTKQLQAFQEEDYDTAVPKFLKLFGDEMMLYATSKSKSLQKGLETSIEFDTWARNNADLVREYPDLATYFAPKGSDFEFSVWDRQKRAGLRVPLSGLELIETAQNRLGATKYRAARRLFGAFPTQQQSEKLKDYRIYLNKQFPGFPINVEFKVNELKNDLVTLKGMVQDKRLVDNPLSNTIIQYLNAHDQALKAAGGKSLQSKKATPMRAQLYAFGESLAVQNPEFDRIWTRLLVAEVEE